MSELTHAQRTALDAIHIAIQDHEPVLGPGKFYGGEDLDPEPKGNCLLSEWALVISWVDEAGNSFLVKVAHEQALDHQVSGLLWTALNQM
jgi:hypothetical protein